MAITNPYLKTLLCSPNYHSRLLGLVIDEAHCIVQWGKDFRPTYSKLDKLQLYIPVHIPIYATSATVTPEMLLEIHRVLHISPIQSFHLNLGNDCPNIYQELTTIPNSMCYSAFDFLFDSIMEATDLPRALIFVNWVVDSLHGGSIGMSSCRCICAAPWDFWMPIGVSDPRKKSSPSLWWASGTFYGSLR